MSEGRVQFGINIEEYLETYRRTPTDHLRAAMDSAETTARWNAREMEKLKLDNQRLNLQRALARCVLEERGED